MDTDLAYLAGVIDSDGCITISRAVRHFHRPRTGHEWESVYYAAKVSISGTRSEPHDLARQLFGGSLSVYDSPDIRHRPVYTWCCEGPKAVGPLTALLPFLRVKPKQALLALEFVEMVTGQWATIKATTKPPYRVPAEMLVGREDLWRRMGVLNEPTNRRRHLLPEVRPA